MNFKVLPPFLVLAHFSAAEIKLKSFPHFCTKVRAHEHLESIRKIDKALGARGKQVLLRAFEKKLINVPIIKVLASVVAGV